MSSRLSFWLPASFGLGAAAISHVEARAYIVAAFQQLFGRGPTLREAQFVQAVGWGESHYGAWWKGDCAGSNNMGAVQVPGGPPCNPATSCQNTDTHEDGAPYQACFRRYPTPTDGFLDLVRQVYVTHGRSTVLRAAQSGDIRAFSTALRASGYFELPLEQHVKGITNSLKTITTALHEPMPSASSAPAAAGVTLADAGIAIAAGVVVVKLLQRYRA